MLWLLYNFTQSRATAAMRLALQAQEQQQFLQAHRGLPRLFTASEVGRLNATRPADDQLEVMIFFAFLFSCRFTHGTLWKGWERWNMWALKTTKSLSQTHGYGVLCKIPFG